MLSHCAKLVRSSATNGSGNGAGPIGRAARVGTPVALCKNEMKGPFMRMKHWIAPLLIGLFAVAPLWAQQGVGQPAQPAQNNPPTSAEEKVSYSFGIAVGRDLRRSMQQQGLNIDLQMLLRGIADALQGKSALSDAQLQQNLQALEQQARESAAQRNAQTEQQAARNLKASQAFLEANKKKPDVKTLPSGLQYKVLKSGNGPSPDKDDRVRTHYHGTLIDGTVFDSSVQRGEPVEFPVSGVIPGWTEALQLMNVGDKWRLFIPPELAYGRRGAGEAVGPNQALIFDVELLEVLP
jgi:FKBP-type peptidyl-prolyl cis-trans isomerase FklB